MILLLQRFKTTGSAALEGLMIFVILGSVSRLPSSSHSFSRPPCKTDAHCKEWEQLIQVAVKCWTVQHLLLLLNKGVFPYPRTEIQTSSFSFHCLGFSCAWSCGLWHCTGKATCPFNSSCHWDGNPSSGRSWEVLTSSIRCGRRDLKWLLKAWLTSGVTGLFLISFSYFQKQWFGSWSFGVERKIFFFCRQPLVLL